MDHITFRLADEIRELVNSLSFDDAIPLWERFLRVRRELPDSEQRRFVSAANRYVRSVRFSELSVKFDDFLIEWEALV